MGPNKLENLLTNILVRMINLMEDLIVPFIPDEVKHG
jgi:hypothetical protein